MNSYVNGSFGVQGMGYQSMNGLNLGTQGNYSNTQGNMRYGEAGVIDYTRNNS